MPLCSLTSGRPIACASWESMVFIAGRRRPTAGRSTPARPPTPERQPGEDHGNAGRSAQANEEQIIVSEMRVQLSSWYFDLLRILCRAIGSASRRWWLPPPPPPPLLLGAGGGGNDGIDGSAQRGQRRQAGQVRQRHHGSARGLPQARRPVRAPAQRRDRRKVQRRQCGQRQQGRFRVRFLTDCFFAAGASLVPSSGGAGPVGRDESDQVPATQQVAAAIMVTAVLACRPKRCGLGLSFAVSSCFPNS